MTTAYLPPRLLEPTDDVQHFECRSHEQTQWLRDHARQAHTAAATKVLVVTPTYSSSVVAYYAWSMAIIAHEDSPTCLRKGAGRYPQAVALLARLGVSIDHEGHGLGAALLANVISRAAQIGSGIGCRGLLVHAESESARNFYLHLIPEFEPSPTDPLHLVLLMKDIHRTLRS